jgi:hypothetical protein
MFCVAPAVVPAVGEEQFALIARIDAEEQLSDWEIPKNAPPTAVINIKILDRIEQDYLICVKLDGSRPYLTIMAFTSTGLNG